MVRDIDSHDRCIGHVFIIKHRGHGYNSIGSLDVAKVNCDLSEWGEITHATA